MFAHRAGFALLISSLLLFPQTRGARAPAVAAKRSTAGKATAGESAQVSRWMQSLTLHDRVAQLIVIPFYGDNPSVRSKTYRKFAEEVRQTRVGGMILVNRSENGLVKYAEPTAAAAFLNRMQKLTRIPLIVGGDFERGASMRVLSATKFPHSMAFAAASDLEAARQLGAATARESRAIGVQWVFAPVADVNNNPDNPIINIRAFSENPNEVAKYVTAFIEGARSDPRYKVLVTVKHFPGHGDTNVDTHAGLGRIDAGKQRLEELELVPFRAAIADGIDSVMTAHLWVPAIESRELPSTVSPAVLTGLLRNELNFRGIITTDAMDMDGLRKQFPSGEAAVRAIEAGADVLLMPPHPEAAVRAVVAAVRSGRITRKRIDQSVEKLLRAKVRLGLHRQRLVDLEAIGDELATEEDNQLARRVAGEAVTLVRNEGGLVPLAAPERACWYALSESRYGQQGRTLISVLKEQMPGAKRALLDPMMPMPEIEEAAKLAGSCDVSVVAAFAGFRGNGALSENFMSFFKLLEASGKPLVLVGMGNPYLLRAFPAVKAYLATFSTVPASELAMLGALRGEISIQGRLPVTIPGVAKYGDGLKVAQKARGSLTEGSTLR
ncbi:MAG: glycoside hydrolase family 3 protein [Bryobacterales bacterium]|nr:glycoside hydrolase family 3 protein [Bryobacterales bacterium]